MKKILIVISLLLLCSCSKREDYYVFSFDDISITPGYDTVEFMRLVFDVKADGTIKGKQHMEDVKVFSGTSISVPSISAIPAGKRRMSMKRS